MEQTEFPRPTPAELDRWLDEALEETFPASDPIESPLDQLGLIPARNCAGSPGAG